jgi:low temperature requirement protein LtrA
MATPDDTRIARISLNQEHPPERSASSGCANICITLVGQRKNRTFWGREPPDFGWLCGVRGDAPSPEPLDHHQPSPIYSMPRPWRVWADGSDEEGLAASWLDLFVDLIYVGAAFRLGDTVYYSFLGCGGSAAGSGRRLADGGGGGSESECAGLWWGVAYAAGLFWALAWVWRQDMYDHARYEYSDRSHVLLSLFSVFWTLLAAAHIGEVETYRGTHGFLDGTDFASFLFPLLIVHAIHMARTLELALAHPVETVRRFASSHAISQVACLLLNAGAITVVASPGASRAESDVALLLTVVGNWWFVGRKMVHIHINSLLRKRGHNMWPVARKMVPLNIEYVIHRFSEFMMLMLGETILQAVIAERSDVIESERTGYGIYLGTQAAGFVLTLCMLYSYHITEPHESKDHGMKRSGAAGIMFDT